LSYIKGGIIFEFCIDDCRKKRYIMQALELYIGFSRMPLGGAVRNWLPKLHILYCEERDGSEPS
jgi:hypothetical protein